MKYRKISPYTVEAYCWPGVDDPSAPDWYAEALQRDKYAPNSIRVVDVPGYDPTTGKRTDKLIRQAIITNHLGVSACVPGDYIIRYDNPNKDLARESAADFVLNYRPQIMETEE